MPRKWGVEARNPGKNWDSLGPVFAPVLSERDILVKRWELAQEMVQLILAEGNLSAKPRRTLEGISSRLRQFRRQL
jgi:hypothetical protein